MPGINTRAIADRKAYLGGGIRADTNPFSQGSNWWLAWNAANPEKLAEQKGSQLAGTSPSNYSTAYGGIPATADPSQSAAAAITGSQANMPALQEMASGINQFNLGEQLGQYETALPGYGNMVGQSAGNIGSRLRGELPGDVVSQMTQQAAERGVSMGVPGSPFSNSELIKSLGLTSLGLQTQAENELTQAIGRTPVVPLFNTSSFLTSPQAQQEAQQQANFMAAAPVPAKAQQTALDIAKAGIQAGSNSVPQNQFQMPSYQTPETQSYNMVSDILNRYAPQQQPQQQQQQQFIGSQQSSPVQLANAQIPQYQIPPSAASMWDFGGEMNVGLPAYQNPEYQDIPSWNQETKMPEYFGIWQD